MKKEDVNAMVSLSEAFGGGSLEVPAGLIKEFAQKKLAYKWVNEAKVIKHLNRHPSGWTVYKSQEYGGADQVVRHGDLVLGVKPLSGAGSLEMHRRALADNIRVQDTALAKHTKNVREED